MSPPSSRAGIDRGDRFGSAAPAPLALARDPPLRLGTFIRRVRGGGNTFCIPSPVRADHHQLSKNVEIWPVILCRCGSRAGCH